jgi:hypothetical protein
MYENTVADISKKLHNVLINRKLAVFCANKKQFGPLDKDFLFFSI